MQAWVLATLTAVAGLVVIVAATLIHRAQPHAAVPTPPWAIVSAFIAGTLCGVPLAVLAGPAAVGSVVAVVAVETSVAIWHLAHRTAAVDLPHVADRPVAVGQSSDTSSLLAA